MYWEIELLPTPAADHFNVLGLDRLNAGEHLDQVALSLGVLLGGGAKLTTEQRCSENRHSDLDRQHREGDQGEQPAVDDHHKDVDCLLYTSPSPRDP